MFLQWWTPTAICSGKTSYHALFEYQRKSRILHIASEASIWGRFFIKSILRWWWFGILEVYIVWQQVKRNCRCHTKRRVYLWLWIMTVAGKIAWWCKGENGIDWSPTHYWGMLWSATNRASANAILQLNSPLCFGIIVHSWLLKWLTTRHLTIVQNKTRVMPPAKCRGAAIFQITHSVGKSSPKSLST